MLDESWLLLLHSLPAGKGSARVGLWRKLKRSGALPFRTSAHLLPNRPELVERFQWFAQQVKDAGGDATLVFVAGLEGHSHDSLIGLFDGARGESYQPLRESLSILLRERGNTAPETYQVELEKIRRQYFEIREIDFFHSRAGSEIGELLDRATSPASDDSAARRQVPLAVGDYSGRTWLTRPRPAIDRVGSAWLVRRYIDAEAAFVFAEDPSTHPGAVTFDLVGGDFTHCGDDCTFETLLQRFGFEDAALHRLAEAIHDADLGDGKFQSFEVVGLDRTLKGWARLGLADEEILERGLDCFDGLFAMIQSE